VQLGGQTAPKPSIAEPGNAEPDNAIAA
jgi:hypothetical protein